MAAPVDLEVALWPAALPKERTGWGTLGRALGALTLFCAPLAILTAIGHNVGPLTKDHAPNDPITIEGYTHEVTFDLPWACSLDLSDSAMNTITCNEDDREIQLMVRPVESIDDLAVAAKRGAREGTLNRFALEFPSLEKDVQGGKASYVSAGTGLFGMNVDAMAVSPEADKSGFVFKINESITEDGAETVVPEMSDHLIKSISFTKIEEGK